MQKSEKRVEQEIMLAVSKTGGVIFKNNVGQAYTKDGQPFRYGLVKGSSDLIGITPVTITQDMVGSTLGVFTAIEVKKSRTGYGLRPEQEKFLEVMKKNGAYCGVAYDDESALDIIKK